MRIKLDDNTGSRWLHKHGGDIKGMGLGYTMGVTMDRSKIRTAQHAINEAALRGKPIVKQTFTKKAAS